MKIFIEKEQKNEIIFFEGKAKDLLKKLKIDVNTVLVVQNGELITEDDIIKDKDEIKILSVISGG